MSSLAPDPVHVTGPAGLVAAVPALLGFAPTHSLVAVLLCDSRVACTARFDLDSPVPQVVASLTGAAANGDADRVVLVAYADAPDEHTVLAVSEELTVEGLDVLDVLHVRNNRWRSLACHSPACCPPEGHPIPDGTTQLEAEQVLTGRPAVALSREQLAQRYIPRPDLAPGPEAFRAAARLTSKPLKVRVQQAHTDLALLATVACGPLPAPVDPDEIARARARLVVLVDDVIVRDHVLGVLASSDDDISREVEALTQATLTCPEFLRPRIAGMAAAITAATAGSPVAVWALIDLSDDDSLARLVASAVTAGLSPQQMRGVLAEALPAVEEQIAK